METGVAQGLLLLGPYPELLNVLGGVAAHVADPHGDAIAHAHDAHLTNRVLLKILSHKVHGVVESQQVPVRQQVLLGHGEAHIEHEHEVSDDAAL